MWEQLTPADIQQVRHGLALERAAILSRHAEELKAQDTQRDEIETLERLVEAFARKYINSETSPSQAATPSAEQPTPAVVADASRPAHPEMPQQDAPSPGLQIHQQVTPNFGPHPLRRIIGR
jgi:hypothetical protein